MKKIIYSKNENSLTNNTINENHWISSKRVSIAFNGNNLKNIIYFKIYFKK